MCSGIGKSQSEGGVIMFWIILSTVLITFIITSSLHSLVESDSAKIYKEIMVSLKEIKTRMGL